MSEKAAPIIRVATYNVHGCVGMDGRRSESRVAQVIAELAVDIVGLDLSCEDDDRRRVSVGGEQGSDRI